MSGDDAGAVLDVEGLEDDDAQGGEAGPLSPRLGADLKSFLRDRGQLKDRRLVENLEKNGIRDADSVLTVVGGRLPTWSKFDATESKAATGRLTEQVSMPALDAFAMVVWASGLSVPRAEAAARDARTGLRREETDQELATRAVEELRKHNLLEHSMVHDATGKRGYCTITVMNNNDGAVKLLAGKDKAPEAWPGGFFCTCCNSGVPPLYPPPAAIDPEERDCGGRGWITQDSPAEDDDATVRPSRRKRKKTSAQPPQRPATSTAPFPDVVDFKFTTAANGWARSSKPGNLKNLVTHVQSPTHLCNLSAERLRARTMHPPCGFPLTIPAPAVGVQLCRVALSPSRQVPYYTPDAGGGDSRGRRGNMANNSDGGSGAAAAVTGRDRRGNKAGGVDAGGDADAGDSGDFHGSDDEGRGIGQSGGIGRKQSTGPDAGRADSGSLSTEEQAVVRAEGRCLYSIAEALLRIADGQLYRVRGFASFVEYIAGTPQLGFRVRRAKQYLSAARFMRLLPPDTQMPTSERQIRSLPGLGPSAAVAVWKRVVELSVSRGVSITQHLVNECMIAMGRGENCVTGSASSDSGDEVAEEDDERVAIVPTQSVFFRSRSNEWYTPNDILDAVREVFAPDAIDLDPCSTLEANNRVRAAAFYDVESDGLDAANAWSGNVFLNPPFGTRDGTSLQGLFFKRCIDEYRAGSVKGAVVLLKAAVGYGWFRAVYDFPHCLLSTRVSFVRAAVATREEGDRLQWGARLQNPHGSVVVYMGPNQHRFADVFGRMGSIPGFNAWSLPQDDAQQGGSRG